VTLRLQYRYIWIDRYCIPQSDEREQQTQIKNMGSIYTSAEATIVAAAGADPAFGLSGAAYRNPTSPATSKNWASRSMLNHA